MTVKPCAATRYRRNWLKRVRLPFWRAELAPRRAATVAMQPVGRRIPHRKLAVKLGPQEALPAQYAMRKSALRAPPERAGLTDRDERFLLELLGEPCPRPRVLARAAGDGRGCCEVLRVHYGVGGVCGGHECGDGGERAVSRGSLGGVFAGGFGRAQKALLEYVRDD